MKSFQSNTETKLKFDLVSCCEDEVFETNPEIANFW